MGKNQSKTGADTNVHRITITDEQDNAREWLVFSRPVYKSDENTGKQPSSDHSEYREDSGMDTGRKVDKNTGKQSASDYKSIRAKNRKRYGTDIGDIIRKFLVDSYDDRTHFIFELLQNAEDALARRGPRWQGSRTVSFELTQTQLRVRHSGQPFENADVWGICSIGRGTKEQLTTIGQFGIGFKSIYTITERPEIYSGAEAFAIEDYLMPHKAKPVSLVKDKDDTLFIFPFKQDNQDYFKEVFDGFKRLIDATTLLFLRHIEEVRWSAEDGDSGFYRRDSQDKDNTTEKISKEQHAGYAEIAFEYSSEAPKEIKPVKKSPLAVFFPTVFPTDLGFLLQGPYHTTPQRDNVRQKDRWNEYLVKETGSVLVNALRWLRDKKSLDTATLRCLPIDSSKFDGMFAPIFEATKEALKSEKLLPRASGGYTSAECARLGRTKDLRNLLNASQLATLLQKDEKTFWIKSDDISAYSDLERYLRRELDIQEIIPEYIIRRLNQQFLEEQTDDWIQKLYKFLRGQVAMRKELDNLPLIRLRSGKHVSAKIDGRLQAFMPSEEATDPYTVKKSVCETDEAREFLKWMGIRERDPVDDVVLNILPRYKKDKIKVTSQYGKDIRRISKVFETAPKDQRDKLIRALRNLRFVIAVDARRQWLVAPSEVYLATDNLKALFKGVEGIFIINDSHACLCSKGVLNLLRECGAAECLRPTPIHCHLPRDELEKIRRKAGLELKSWNNPIEDRTLCGLDKILQLLPNLEPEEQKLMANFLWKALDDVRNKHDDDLFIVDYVWGYMREVKSAKFNPEFIDKLKKTAWIPDGEGNLQKPEFIDFDSLGWEENSLLLSKIRFKPTAVKKLEEEAGVEPGMVDMLKQHGITTLDGLRSMINDREEPEDDSNGQGNAGPGGGNGGGTKPPPKRGDKPRPPKPTRENFISYIAMCSDDEEPHMRDLRQDDRMRLEEKAIKFIESLEPEWKRTPKNNRGFDLYKTDENDNPIKWCEVKAMTNSLENHPVGMSHAQFEDAQKHRESYWLYIVENADTDEPNLIRIKDPAGWKSIFTFDHGWKKVSEQSDD